MSELFIERIAVHDSEDDALDQILEYFDHLFCEGRFHEANGILENVPTDEFPTVLLIGLLTAGNWAQSRLPGYARFFAAVEKTFRERGVTKRLLDGLAPAEGREGG